MDLPPDDTLRWLVCTYARLHARYSEAIGAPEVLQPTGEFFPDEFRLDPASVETLLRRMLGYSPVADDLGLELAFVAPEGGAGGGGCGSSACGTGGGSVLRAIEELEDGYRVFVPAADVRSPELLTTALARAVGALVLAEAGEEADAGEQEVAAVACGFGVLLANGAAVWAKSCGGLRMAQATSLSVEEVAVAVALFGAVQGRRVPRAHLGATQREAFDLAVAWVESNPLLVETLRLRPAELEKGFFELEPVRGLLGRWMHKRRLEKELSAPAAPAAAPLSDDRRRRLAEARALVDEVLGSE